MNFDETCPSFRIKELDELSDNINILSASLNKALTDLRIFRNDKIGNHIEPRTLERSFDSY